MPYLLLAIYIYIDSSRQSILLLRLFYLLVERAYILLLFTYYINTLSIDLDS